VSGSDWAWSEQIEKLKDSGARVYVGHNASQMIPPGSLPPDALVVSSAVGPGNEEVDAAFALNVPV
jgi:UDP-N-acetylmuramate-alanine ligase